MKLDRKFIQIIICFDQMTFEIKKVNQKSCYRDLHSITYKTNKLPVNISNNHFYHDILKLCFITIFRLTYWIILNNGDIANLIMKI